MPWVAPITGYVDRLGYLYCCDCIGDRTKDFVVDGDNGAMHGFRCDGCGWRFPAILSRDYVQVAYGAPRPELKKPQPSNT